MADTLFDNAEIIDIDLEIDGELIESEVETVVKTNGTSDYRALTNKPSINGKVLEDNFDEEDPTVPDWAKESTKPQYNPEEIGTSPNVNDEYFWDGEKYEIFGTTQVDLTGYLKESDLVEMSAEDVQAVWDSVFNV